MVFKGMLKGIKHSTSEETHPNFSDFSASSEASTDAVHIACENVRQNIADAVHFLRDKLAKSKASFRAFHQLPWYLVIGPENSGKTRLLSKSQLSFLEKDRFVQLTPSRINTSGYINWWFTQGATLLDVPGNFLESTQSLTAPRACWLELLRQLKRLRPKNPIQGVVLTIDIQTLSQPIEDLAKSLGQRLQEIAYRLKQAFPVYIVCTQTDKILGFNEYFDDLGKTERDQHLGITFPLHFNHKNSPSQTFSETFDKLLQNLHQRALWRIHHDRDIARRKLIQHFPYQLNNLKENLQRLVYDLSTSSYQMAVRGIYFTGTGNEDEETAIDTINTHIEKNFSLLPTRHSHSEASYSAFSSVSSSSSAAFTGNEKDKTFFIKQLFHDRIFAEAAVVTDALRAPPSWRDHFFRFLTLGVASAGLISITIFWSHQYQNQKNYLTQTGNALSVYRLLSLAYNPHPVDLTTLVPSLNALSLAHNNATEAKLPWLLRFQLHHERSISSLTNALYLHALQTKLIPAVRGTLAWQLQSQNITDSTELYSTFQAYLMLGNPVHMDKQFLTQWFSQDWQNTATRNPEFMAHLDAALQNPLPARAPNTTLVTQIRANLNALPYSLLAEAILRTKLSPQPIQPIQLSKQHVFAFPPEGIPEIFTTKDLNKIDSQLNDSLSEAIQGNWVLGHKKVENLTTNDISGLKQELMNGFAQDYANVWTRWLNQIQFSSIRTTGQLEFALQELTSEHSPLKQIIVAVAKNTNFAGVRSTDPSFMTTLQNNLAPRFAGFYDLSTTKKWNTFLAPLKTLQSELHQQKSTATTVTTILKNARIAPVPLNQWLFALAQSVGTQGLTTWQQQIYPTCHAVLDNHYPFSPTAPQAVSVHDFEHYFAQGGIMGRFFLQNLAPFVDTTQAQWQWINTSSPFAQSNTVALGEFERGSIIHQLYFNNQNQLAVPFTLTLMSASPSVKKAELLVDGKVTTQKSFTWPKDTNNLSITLIDHQGKPYALNETGSWALFKLLEHAQVTPHPGNQKFTVVFNIDGYRATYLLTAQPLNPFTPGFITSFQCPKFQ